MEVREWDLVGRTLIWKLRDPSSTLSFKTHCVTWMSHLPMAIGEQINSCSSGIASSTHPQQNMSSGLFLSRANGLVFMEESSVATFLL